MNLAAISNPGAGVSLVIPALGAAPAQQNTTKYLYKASIMFLIVLCNLRISCTYAEHRKSNNRSSTGDGHHAASIGRV
jgi:hypothetical protein